MLPFKLISYGFILMFPTFTLTETLKKDERVYHLKDVSVPCIAEPKETKIIKEKRNNIEEYLGELGKVGKALNEDKEFERIKNEFIGIGLQKIDSIANAFNLEKEMTQEFKKKRKPSIEQVLFVTERCSAVGDYFQTKYHEEINKYCEENIIAKVNKILLGFLIQYKACEYKKKENEEEEESDKILTSAEDDKMKNILYPKIKSRWAPVRWLNNLSVSKGNRHHGGYRFI